MDVFYVFKFEREHHLLATNETTDSCIQCFAKFAWKSKMVQVDLAKKWLVKIRQIEIILTVDRNYEMF